MWKFVSISAFVLVCATAASAADLTVTINGLRNANGSVAAAIFNTETNFPRALAFSSFRI